MKVPNNKKVIRKHVLIQSSEQTERRVVSKYNKFQLLMAKILRVELADNYQYVFRLDYKGTVRLKPNDIICNDNGIIFLVMRETNRIAMLVSKDAYQEKPKMWGKLTIIDKLNK